MEPVHLASPFAFNARGVANTVVQDSEADRRNRAYNVCVCIEGEREDNPPFGIPDLTFASLPLNLRPLETAIERWAEVPVTASEAEEAYVAARRVTIEIG